MDSLRSLAIGFTLTTEKRVALLKGFCLVVLLFLTGIQNLRAQDDACFTFIGDSVGCAPFRVRVRSCALGNAIISYNFRWRPGAPATDYNIIPNNIRDTAFVYDTPGTYIIEQFRGGTRRQQRTVRVYDANNLPSFSLSSCFDTLLISIADTQFTRFQIDYGDGNSTFVNKGDTVIRKPYTFATNKATFTVSVKGLIPSTCNQTPVVRDVTLYKVYPEPDIARIEVDEQGGNYLAKLRTKAYADLRYAVYERRQGQSYTFRESREEDSDEVLDWQLTQTNRAGSCYKIGLVRGCGDTLWSAEVCDFPLSAVGGNQRIQLTWPRHRNDSLQTLRLFRDNVFVGDLNVTDSTFLDETGLRCGVAYCYRLVGTYVNTQIENPLVQVLTVSDTVCAFATSTETPKAVTFATASVENGLIQIAWQRPSDYTPALYTVTKQFKNQTFSLLGTTTFNILVDSAAKPSEGVHCYRIQYVDVCDNESEVSASICPVLLNVELSKTQPLFKNFVWTPMQGWSNGVRNYFLQYLSPSGSPYREVNAARGLNLSQPERDTLRQRLRIRLASVAVDFPLIDTSFSNEVEVLQPNRADFPQAFTPNFDRLNDEFKGFVHHFTSFELVVYNRWGQEVFRSDNKYNGWDGTFQGKECPSGVYSWSLRGQDESGEKVKKAGTVTLLR